MIMRDEIATKYNHKAIIAVDVEQENLITYQYRDFAWEKLHAQDCNLQVQTPVALHYGHYVGCHLDSAFTGCSFVASQPQAAGL